MSSQTDTSSGGPPSTPAAGIAPFKAEMVPPLAPRDQRSARNFQTLFKTPRQPIDLFGRHNIPPGEEKRLAEVSDLDIKKNAIPIRKGFATITKNQFKYKSLSNWAYNFAVGCAHACRFCYVPATQRSGNAKAVGAKANPLNVALHAHGVEDPDAEWGEYFLPRPWDEVEFLRTLKSAENKPRSKLKRDGNRAVIFSSTTDPFQGMRSDDPVKRGILSAQREFLVRRALELIWNPCLAADATRFGFTGGPGSEQRINVRILTRGAPKDDDWEVLQRLAEHGRVLFGVSLPTTTDGLMKLYEQSAPRVTGRLKTLEKAQKLGIPLFVAMAPTYPECDEADLRKTLKQAAEFKPVTVFHEPINTRAENIARIQKRAEELKEAGELKVEFKAEVFKKENWAHYAYTQLTTVEKIANEVGLGHCLHLWPDKILGKRAAFNRIWAKEKELDPTMLALSKEEKDGLYRDTYLVWLSKWWNRTSYWPTRR